MSKRNIISEIQEKNRRATNPYLSGHIELYSIEHTFENLGKSQETLLSLLVMGVASCIEVSARAAIKRLVDSGNPYLERAESFKDNIKFDFSLTRSLSSGEITFGDLISHSLPVSRVDHISSHFEVLFKGDRPNFKDVLSQVRVYAEPDDDELFGEVERGTTQSKAPLLIDDVDAVLKDIGLIFETRHLVAHEANFKAVSFDEFSRFLSSARLFVDALYEMVEQILHLGVSRNGFGGSIQYRYKASDLWSSTQEVQNRIAEQVNGAGPEFPGLKELFEKTIKAFDDYYESEQSFRLASYGMLTGNGMRNVESHVMLQLYQHRLDYLKIVEEDTKFLLNR